METANSEYLSFEEFRKKSGNWFASGTWRIQYNDRTHLPNDNFINIGDAVIEQSGTDKLTLFSFKPNLAERRLSSLEGNSEDVDLSTGQKMIPNCGRSA